MLTRWYNMLYERRGLSSVDILSLLPKTLSFLAC